MSIFRSSAFWLTLLVGELLAWLTAAGIATLATLATAALSGSEYPSGRLLRIIGFTVHAVLAIAAFLVARSFALKRASRPGFDVLPK